MLKYWKVKIRRETYSQDGNVGPFNWYYCACQRWWSYQEQCCSIWFSSLPQFDIILSLKVRINTNSVINTYSLVLYLQIIFYRKRSSIIRWKDFLWRWSLNLWIMMKNVISLILSHWFKWLSQCVVVTKIIRAPMFVMSIQESI